MTKQHVVAGMLVGSIGTLVGMYGGGEDVQAFTGQRLGTGTLPSDLNTGAEVTAVANGTSKVKVFGLQMSIDKYGILRAERNIENTGILNHIFDITRPSNGLVMASGVNTTINEEGKTLVEPTKSNLWSYPIKTVTPLHNGLSVVRATNLVEVEQIYRIEQANGYGGRIKVETHIKNLTSTVKGIGMTQLLPFYINLNSYNTAEDTKDGYDVSVWGKLYPKDSLVKVNLRGTNGSTKADKEYVGEYQKAGINSGTTYPKGYKINDNKSEVIETGIGIYNDIRQLQPQEKVTHIWTMDVYDKDMTPVVAINNETPKKILKGKPLDVYAELAGFAKAGSVYTQYKVDNGAYRTLEGVTLDPNTSKKNVIIPVSGVEGLSVGEHTVTVRGVSPIGTYSEPQTHTFRVSDLVPIDVEIDEIQDGQVIFKSTSTEIEKGQEVVITVNNEANLSNTYRFPYKKDGRYTVPVGELGGEKYTYKTKTVANGTEETDYTAEKIFYTALKPMDFTLEKYPTNKAVYINATKVRTHPNVSNKVRFTEKTTGQVYESPSMQVQRYLYTLPEGTYRVDNVVSRSVAGLEAIYPNGEIYLDATPPPKPVIEYDKKLTNQDVLIKIKTSGDTVRTTYRVNDDIKEYTEPFYMTANGEITVTAYDESGNYSITREKVLNIDKTPPTKPSFTYDTRVTENPITVTVNFTSDSYKRQYRKETGEWVDFVGSNTKFIAESNGTYYARAFDEAGNESEISTVTITNIEDKPPAKPTLSYNSEPTNQDVFVQATFDKKAEKKWYRIDNGAWLSYTEPIRMVTNGKVEVRGEDSKGRMSEVAEALITNIDKEPPTNPVFTYDKRLTNQSVPVTITYSEDSVKKEYKVGNGTWQTYQEPITIAENTILYARGTDSVGNVSVEVQEAIRNIDKTPPTAPVVSYDKEETNKGVEVSVDFGEDAVEKWYKEKDSDVWLPYEKPLQIDENKKLEFKGVDSVGNESEITQVVIDNIDKTPPTAPQVSYDQRPTNQNVQVTAEYSQDSEVKLYKGETGEWQVYTGHLNVENNGRYWFKGVDKAGNESEVTAIHVTNIDREPPEKPRAEYAKQPTNQDIPMTIHYSADSVLKEYRIGAGEWQPYTDTLLVKGNGVIQARAYDEAGNMSEVMEETISHIDKEPPSTPTYHYNTQRTNQDIDVTIQYSEDSTKKWYKVGEAGEWQLYTAPIQVQTNGKIYAKAEDAVGNMSEEAIANITNIDKEPPEDPMVTYDTQLTNQDVWVTVTYSTDSAVKLYREGTTGEWKAYVGTLQVKQNGVYQFKALDDVGNESRVVERTITNIDKEPPEAPTVTYDKRVTNQSVTLEAEYSADSEKRYYREGTAGVWKAYVGSIEVQQNGVYQFKGEDKAGNESTLTEVTITNIDKEPPEAPMVTYDKQVTKNPVLVEAMYSEDSVLKLYRKAGEAWQPYTTAFQVAENGTYEFKGLDEAGNESSSTYVTITNIDTEAPTTPIASYDKSPTNQAVQVTIAYSEDSAKKWYKVGEAGKWQPYTQAIEVTDNVTVYAKAEDEAGNVSELMEEAITNIDKEPPTTPIAEYSREKTSGNVAVQINYSMDSDRKEVKIGEGEWQPYTGIIEVSENHTTVYARAYDAVGNVSEVMEETITNIDREAPNLPVIVYDNRPTNRPVQVTIDYSEDSTKKWYKVGEAGEWQLYTQAIEVTDNVTVYAKAEDEVGNATGEVQATIDNIDKEPPEIPVITAPTKLTYLNVPITITYSEDSVKKWFKVGEAGEWQPYIGEYAMENNGVIYAKAEDEAGNESDITTYHVTNIDREPPADPIVTYDKRPTKGNVLLTATYSEDSVLRLYRTETSGWQPYTDTIEVTENSTYYFVALDEAQNTSNHVKVEITNIDREPPQEPQFTYDDTPTNQNVPVTIHYSEDSAYKYYRINGGEWQTYQGVVEMEGNGVLEAYAEDEVGNQSSLERLDVTNIDKEPPVKPTASYDKKKTNQNVEVTLHYSEDSFEKQYRKEGEELWRSYREPLEITENMIIYARAIDKVGNISDVMEEAITNIDKEPPAQPKVTYDTKPAREVTMYVEWAEDSEQNYYQKEGDTLWTALTEDQLTVIENGTYRFKSLDEAGNESSLTQVTLTNIDREPPEAPTYEYDKKTTNQDIPFTIHYSEDSYHKLYQYGDGMWQPYTEPLLVDRNVTIRMKGIDEAGNESEVVEAEIKNIDKVTLNPITLEPSTTAMTNTYVDMTVSGDQPKAVKTYVRIDEAEWVELKTGMYRMQENGRIEAYQEDEAGNRTEIVTYLVTNIDKEPPTNTSDFRYSPYQHEAYYTVKIQDNHRVQRIAIGTDEQTADDFKAGAGETVTNGQQLVWTENGTYRIYAEDEAGNYVTQDITVTDLSDLPADTLGFEQDITALTNQKVHVTPIIGTIDKAIQVTYQKDGGEWLPYSEPIPFSENGEVTVRIENTVSGKVTEGTHRVTNIYKKAPSVQMQIGNDKPTNQTIVGHIEATSEIGIAELRMKKGKQTQTDFTAEDRVVSDIEIAENGYYTVYAKDIAGNEQIQMYRIVNIHKQKPNPPKVKITQVNQEQVVEITGQKDVIPNEKVEPEQDVTILGEQRNDTEENRLEWWHEDAWKVYEGEKFEPTKKYKLRLVDNVGNISDETIFEVPKLENPPVEKPDPPTEPSEPNEKPDPPTEPSEPNEKPNPPSEPSEPNEKPDPPSEPSEPNEKPDPPSEPSEPNEKPDPPSEPSESNEKPDPPTKPSEPNEKPTNPTIVYPTTDKQPIAQPSYDLNLDEIVAQDKEDELPKTGTEKESAGLLGILTLITSFFFLRRKQ